MLKVKAFAKLNLNLHVLPEKLPNGYFEVKFINCQISLHDNLFVEAKKSEINIVCDNPCVPLDGNNLVSKAARLIKEMLKRDDLGAKIILEKNIPVKSGLGGGSCDAASAIRALTKLWKIKLDQKQLNCLAGQLGCDVYYCLEGGVCEIKGDGSEVTPLNIQLPEIYLIIITPSEEKPSTAWMYKHLDEDKIGRNLDRFERLKKALIKKNRREIINNLYNDFEDPVIRNFPVVAKIKKDLVKLGADNSLLAGSGLSVVGFFTKREIRDQAFQVLNKTYTNIIAAKIKN